MVSPKRAELPLPDYDHLPVATLRHRIRSLSADQVHQLMNYEKAHAARFPVLEALQHRIDQLAAGAEPSEGSQRTRPEQPPDPAGGPPVSEQTAAPPAGAPPHGVPLQSGKPKGNYQPGQG
ncbi:MAG: hypothetical protein GEV03_26580 [Streptosporangiales bacterium]|nr:hypothetical protein [Streptosporangiales bacterium]